MSIIGECHELKLTLEALAGHDTSELHDAIKESIVKHAIRQWTDVGWAMIFFFLVLRANDFWFF